MGKVIFAHHVRNVNGALARAMELFDDGPNYDEEQTRNGLVRVARGPVYTETQKPLERVLFSPLRNANPFFHLMESLWMLGGRNDLGWLKQFNKRMELYSDDGGVTQPAAYGHRWRGFFGYDQLNAVVQELTERPNSRRAVLAMWDSRNDLSNALNGSNDVPCNTHAYFRLRTETDGSWSLDMTVCCRSNDVLWGAHGANAVHFSVLLEYLAARLGVEVGSMGQFSYNYHVYTDVLMHRPDSMAYDCRANDWYQILGYQATPLFTPGDVEQFDRELPSFLEYAGPQPRAGTLGVSGGFLAHTALPMLETWDMHKAGQLDEAIDRAADIGGEDWRVACRLWLDRIKEKRDARA